MRTRWWKPLVSAGAAALLLSTTVAAVAPGDDSAAERYGWGNPLPQWPDEFDYGSPDSPGVPDESKWYLAGGGVGQCWPGHAGNGRRCKKNTVSLGEFCGRSARRTGTPGGWRRSSASSTAAGRRACARSRPANAGARDPDQSRVRLLQARGSAVRSTFPSRSRRERRRTRPPGRRDRDRATRVDRRTTSATREFSVSRLRCLLRSGRERPRGRTVVGRCRG
jgi:hypothetical protein